MRKFLTLSVVFLLACTLFACAKAEVEPVVVRYLNDDPAAHEAWQALADSYTRSTGIVVEIETVSENYAAVLPQRLKEENAPAAFAYRPEAENFCAPLANTALSHRLPAGFTANRSFPYAFQKSWGVLVNRALLQAAGFQTEDLTNYLSLKDAAQSIHNRKSSLGFDAFSPPSQEDLSAIMPLFKGYSTSLRWFWELCSLNCSANPGELSTVTPEMSLDAFGKGEAVFYIQSTDVYFQLVRQYNMSPTDLTLLPLYSGSSEITIPTCSLWHSWGIASDATDAQKQAAVDFLTWVITSQEGTAMLTRQYGGCLFPALEKGENPLLFDAATRLIAGEMAPLWSIPNRIPRFPALYEALTAYTAGNLSWESIDSYLND